MQAYVFVDAENHFHRSTAAAQECLGVSNAAEIIGAAKGTSVPGIYGFPGSINGERFAWDPKLQLFWDCHVLSGGGTISGLNARISRAIYTCSCSGDDDAVHEAQVKLREIGFEPNVVREQKNLQKQRNANLSNVGLIEKPKGCDIALATRMVADASANLFDCCLLFTSDADFLPAIEAVRRMGKVVWVLGYQAGLPKRSPYLYAPDRFIDLERVLKSGIQNNKKKIDEAASLINAQN